MATGESSEADLVLVGHVRKPHGVRGEVLIEVLSDDPERFRPGAEFVARGGDIGRRLLSIVSARPHRGGLLVFFEGFEDREQVAALRGVDLLIEAEAVRAPPEGTYYYFDLIGRACHDRKSGYLGEVIAVREDGGGLLLEIRDDRRTVLVPFVRDYLVSLAREEGPIEFDLPEGLLEVCVSRS